MKAKNIKDLLGRNISKEALAKLNKIVVADGVENIYDNAFSMLHKLKTVVLPASVTSIGEGAFTGCDELKTIIVSKENQVFDSRDNCNAIIKTKDNVLLFGCNYSTIPEGVKRIDLCAFSRCYRLSEISIPKSLNSVRPHLFERSRDSIKSITVNEQNKTLDSRENCNAIINTKTGTLVMGCCSTVIPKGVLAIGKYAFQGCRGIKEIVIPESVYSIDKEAFSGCTNMTSITLSNNVKVINKFAFDNCRSLCSITIPGSLTTISEKVFVGCDGLKDIVIKEGVTTIENSAFFRCPNVETITLPNSIETIGTYFIIPVRGKFKIIVPKGSKKKFKLLLPGYTRKIVEQDL